MAGRSPWWISRAQAPPAPVIAPGCPESPPRPRPPSRDFRPTALACRPVMCGSSGKAHAGTSRSLTGWNWRRTRPSRRSPGPPTARPRAWCSTHAIWRQRPPPQPFFWRVVTVGPDGETLPDVPPARFVARPRSAAAGAPPGTADWARTSELIIHSLRGETPPKFGQLLSPARARAAPEGTELNGRDQMLRYSLAAWPEEDWTVAVRVRIREMPRNRLGQVFSAWCRNVDDPLRLGARRRKALRQDRGWGRILHPRRGAGTRTLVCRGGGEAQRSVAALVDGKMVGSCATPDYLPTQATDCALGGNPHYSGQ